MNIHSNIQRRTGSIFTLLQILIIMSIWWAILISGPLFPSLMNNYTCNYNFTNTNYGSHLWYIPDFVGYQFNFSMLNLLSWDSFDLLTTVFNDINSCRFDRKFPILYHISTVNNNRQFYFVDVKTKFYKEILPHSLIICCIIYIID